MNYIQHTTNHLVKGEDLNHHGTLFAGRCAEWFVESGFVAVAFELDPKSVVCLQIHGMEFLKPVHAGHIVTFSSQIVRTGRSTLTVYVEVRDCRENQSIITDGFITFCHVDEATKPTPHGLVFDPIGEHETELNLRASELAKRKHKN